MLLLLLLQTEWFIGLEDLPAAIASLAKTPALVSLMAHGCEVRVVKADDCILSPCNRRYLSAKQGAASDLWAALHFTLDNKNCGTCMVASDATEALRSIADALAPFNARPHWGKLKPAEATYSSLLETFYSDQGCSAFWNAVLELDPDSKFRGGAFDAMAKGSHQKDGEGGDLGENRGP